MQLRMQRAKWSGGIAAALAAMLWAGGSGDIALAQAGGCGTDLKILVLAGDGTEPSLQAITQTLDYLGTPYVRHVVKQNPNAITPTFLADGCHARFQAILQTTIDLATQTPDGYVSALSQAESDAIEEYQRQFQVRNVAWYTFPSEPLGFTGATAIDTTNTPVTIALTAAGAATFPYLNPAAVIPIRYAYTYRARPASSAITPLLTDSAGNALAALRAWPDGRETLLLTFDHNPDLLHSTLLGYGLVRWATRGLFIGERRTYASPQIDDIFLDNNRWVAGTPCGTDPETTGQMVRMTGADLQIIENWQRARNAQPLTADLRITMAFNGEGTTGIYRHDTLTPTARTLQSSFHWVSHTYDHEYLDEMPYGPALDEIRMNDDVARGLGLTTYTTMSMVTPNITGLTNPAFLQAAVDTGIRYLVSDASKPGYGNPFPNAGIYNPLQPSILMIPRRANNLFYNVATPQDWVHEYNCLYRAFWGRDLSYDEILDYESNQLTMYLLRGENAPWMYHQPNLVAYDGTHTLLTDVLDRALDAYAGYVNWPITSPTMDALGAKMASRMNFLAARVTATLQSGTLTITSDRPVSVPITGLRSPDAEQYGGEFTSRIDVPASGSVTVPVPPAAGALPQGWDHRDIGSVGLSGAASYDSAAEMFTVTGAGADVWGTADALRYAYVPISGDVRITARVASVQSVAAWVKAGVMIRERLDPSSPHGFMLVSAGKGLAFQRRTVAAGLSTSTSGGAGVAPAWVRLEREGSTIRAFSSTDGISWSLVGSDTIPMQASVFAGLGVSSHTVSATATATFDRVTIESLAPSPPPPPPPPPPPTTALPDGWANVDIGATGATGAASFTDGVVSVSGAGADVWGTADAFHYAYRALDGDGSIVARVTSIEAVHAWTKAGVMIRNSLSPSAAQAFMLVASSATKGVPYQRRLADGNTTVSSPGSQSTAPRWVKLTRVGDTITGYESPDGTSWTEVGSSVFTMAPVAYVGLAVSSHVTGVNATATFDNVTITTAAPPPPPPPPPPSTALPEGWTQADIGAVGAAGSSVYDAGAAAFTVTGAGADVWGTADAFQFAWRPWSGDGTIEARVTSVDYVASWVKAGVMIRASTDPDSAHAFMIVSAGKGLAFQRRVAQGGLSVHTSGGAGAAPYWVRLQRAGDLVTASVSLDGTSWRVVGSDTIPMGQAVLVGLGVSSHIAGTTASARFEHVTVR